MIAATWDSGLSWDDPNLRWGDPATLLQPGDPGYVPPAPAPAPLPHGSNHRTKPRTKTHMSKSDYVDPNDREFHGQMVKFKTNIATYGTTVGVTAAQITGHTADTDYFGYIIQCRDLTRSASQQLTAWKNILRAGGNVPLSGAPLAPVFPTTVPPVAPGIEQRFRDLAAAIKKHPNYNPSIGEALGIEGANHAPQSVQAAQPILKLEQSGDHVLIRWSWNGFRNIVDQCEIQVDRGDGQGWRLLTYDTTPDYMDTHPAPATGTRWKYRAIYRADDARVGIWSAEVSILVSA